MKGNTVGSRSDIEKAYIAGFLDGDGSLMLQIKRRSDTRRGFRFMATICLYQDSRHDAPLAWIQSILQAGYISHRNDGISELRINGFTTIHAILSDLKPYIRFKQLQAEAMMTACSLLSKDIRMLSDQEIITVIDLILVIQSENYKAHRKKSRDELVKMCGLTP